MFSLFLKIVLFSLLVDSIVCISVPSDTYKSLLVDRCFNETYDRKPLVLGQREPVGLSIENLISLIEKVERKKPDLNAQQIVILILRRFHIDGLQLTGNVNLQSQSEIMHRRVTDQILPLSSRIATDFPEEALTEDEKCALFYTISHTINETARNDEHIQNTYKRTMSTIFTQNALSSINSKRQSLEKGVASFKNSKTMAIAANRVLLGTAVGLISPPTRTTRDIIRELVSDISLDKVPNEQIDPLLAVTLSDLLGIGSGSGLTIPTGTIQFGADGEWNSTACQTSFRLRTNGTLATLAEFRGSLDGWNIGRKLPEILQKAPKISLSQILRMYYSSRGVSPDSGVCQRQYGINSDLEYKVQREAENYLRVWNVVYYRGSNPDNQLTGFIAETWNTFKQFLKKVSQEKTSEERDFCDPLFGTDIKSSPCESSADVFFILDNEPPEDTGNKEQIEIITQVVKSLNLGRNSGSVSVFVNSNGSSDPYIVDDNNQPLNPPLYALVYNTTSSQCASCRAAYFGNNQISLTNSTIMLELINKTLMQFKLKKADQPGISSKNFVWFDYGGLKPVPTEGGPQQKYIDFKWRLRYEHRDVTFFMATINNDSIKDLLHRDEDWIEVGKGPEDAVMKGIDLANKICQRPQIFQFNKCGVQMSENEIYEGFVTYGYKQYWAMYPQFFRLSRAVQFKFKPFDGDIKVCFNRNYPPERNDENCKDLKNKEEKIFSISDPCRGSSFESCDPFYFTIWGKETTAGSQCLDERCSSFDQIKFAVTHSGVTCVPNHVIHKNYGLQSVGKFANVSTSFSSNGSNLVRFRKILLIWFWFQFWGKIIVSFM